MQVSASYFSEALHKEPLAQVGCLKEMIVNSFIDIYSIKGKIINTNYPSICSKISVSFFKTCFIFYSHVLAVFGYCVLEF